MSASEAHVKSAPLTGTSAPAARAPPLVNAFTIWVAIASCLA